MTLRGRYSVSVLLATLVVTAMLPLGRAAATEPGALTGPFVTAYRMSGETCLARGEWSHAIASFRAALELDPHNAGAHVLCARAYVERGRGWGNRGDVDHAVQHATRALELKPEHAVAHACLGLARSLRCDHQLAAAACDRAMKLAPTSAVVHRYRGIIRSRNDDPDPAADFTRAIECDPRDCWAYLDRADLRRYWGERDKALEDSEKAIALNPTLPAGYTTRSAVWITAREYGKALKDAEKAIALAPNDPLPHLARSYVFLAERHYDTALAAINRAVELAPEAVVVYSARADCRLGVAQPDLAFADCRRALRLDPCDYYTHQVAADCLAAKMETARALAICQAAIRLYPNSPELVAARADLRSRRGEVAGAAADLQLALQMDPRLVRAMLSQAEEHFMARRFEEALAALDRALAVEPECGTALGYRSGCLERLGRSAEAEKAFAAAVKIDRVSAHLDRAWMRLASVDASGGFEDIDAALRERPNDPSLFLFRGWSRLGTARKVPEALADAERAIRLVPENSDAYYLRAQCRDAEGDIDAALADLNRALAIDPHFVAALAHRAQIRMDKDQFSEALNDCDDALALDPDDADALSTRGMLFAMLEPNRVKDGNATQLLTLTGERPTGLPGTRAVYTPGGIRIRGTELLGESFRQEARPGTWLVRTQATSPDGRFVAVVPDSTIGIRLHDTSPGAPVRTLPGNVFGTLAVCFTPDGTQLLSAGRDGCVRVWDVESGTEVKRIAGLTEEVCCLGYTANGGLLTGGQNGAIRLRDAKTGKVLWSQSLSGAVTAVAVSRDGRFALSLNMGTAVLWELRDGKRIGEWFAGNLVRAIAFAPDGRRAIATSADSSVSIIRLPLPLEQALADTTRAIRLQPEREQPLVARGLCHLTAERFGHAKADFTRAIELNSKNPEPYFYRAMIHAQAGDTDRGIEDLSATIGLVEDDAESHLQRGLLYLKKGEYQKAKRDLDRALQLDPKLKSRLPQDK